MKEVATHVIIKGQVFNWADKAPYVRAGVSTYGALEYHEDTKTVKCHECGEWVRSIGQHIYNAHRNVETHKPLTVRDYKIRHGFAGKTGLCAPDLSAVFSKSSERQRRVGNGKISKRTRLKIKQGRARTFEVRRELGHKHVESAESANILAACVAQTKQQLMALCQTLGRRPKWLELDAYINAHGQHVLNHERLAALFDKSTRQVIDDALRASRTAARNASRERVARLALQYEKAIAVASR